jgi:hypothetical protein
MVGAGVSGHWQGSALSASIAISVWMIHHTASLSHAMLCCLLLCYMDMVVAVYDPPRSFLNVEGSSLVNVSRCAK